MAKNMCHLTNRLLMLAALVLGPGLACAAMEDSAAGAAGSYRNGGIGNYLAGLHVTIAPQGGREEA
jgi:hypothetical protein